MLAAKLITETEAAFDKNMDLAMLSESATIEGMAEILRTDGRSIAKTALVAIQTKGTRPILFCWGNCEIYACSSRRVSTSGA